MEAMRIFIYECVSAGALGRDTRESLRREGAAMLDAVVEDFRQLPDVEVVTATSEAFADTAAACDWTLIIAPECDGHLLNLSKTVVDIDGRLLGSSPAAIRLTGDKLATAKFWHDRGVPHPQTQALETADAIAVPPPWVMKPRFGAGSQATFLIRDQGDVAQVWSPAFHECPDAEFVVQPYVRGQAASVTLIVGTGQTIALAPAWQRLSSDGRFHYLGGSLPIPAPLARRATALARQAIADIDGLRGYVGVDLVLGDDGVEYAIEINPRLTTSYLGLRQLCKQNLAGLIVKIVRGEQVSTPDWAKSEVRFGIDFSERIS